MNHTKIKKVTLKADILHVQQLLGKSSPKPDEALSVLHNLLENETVPWPVFHFLGISYLYKNKFKTAEGWLQKSISSGGNESETYYSLSLCYYNLGEYHNAVSFGRKAVEKKEKYAKGWIHLGTVYKEQSQLERALECYQKANNIAPDNLQVAFKIGEIYRDQGRWNKALELFNYILEADEDHVAAYVSSAQILIQKHKFEKAKTLLNKALEKEPQHLTSKIAISNLYRKQGNYEKALHYTKQLLEDYPKEKGLHSNYAICLQEIGRLEEAENHYTKALEEQPTKHQSLSNYLMCIHYNPNHSKEDIYEAHMWWDKKFAPEQRMERPNPIPKNKGEKLRIGLLSGGFCQHPVGWMMTKGLENLPKNEFEIYCYSTGDKIDKITKRINNVVDNWKSVLGYKDEIIADIIKKDNIDILVELSGHAGGNRLRTIALEPAPIIVKWVGGLFNTSGLKSMDFLISDQYETPIGEEKFYTEKLVRMPDDYISFLPPWYAPDVVPLPVKENGIITFGCFNNPAKVNNQILDKWAVIMNQVPNSQLFLKGKQYDTVELRERIIKKMVDCGVSEERLKFEGQTNHKDHLGYYNKVDIALDPWPYSGGLTTCEALWMGVPVVTKPGPTFAGRHSTTHLVNAGYPEWVTDSWDEYIDTAVSLAKDTEKLAELRLAMRDQVANSPLCDGRRFGAHLAVAFREMWKQRVKGYETGADNWQDHINVEALSEEEVIKQTANSVAGPQEEGLENEEVVFDSSFIDEEQKVSEVKLTNQQLNGDSMSTDNISENGIQDQNKDEDDKQIKASAGSEEELFKIETKDEVTICTPANLNLLTPYVLLEQEQWFEPELDFVRAYLKPGMNIVDIGAGFGAYALPAAKLVGESGKIYAFEPGGIARQHLEMSKLENGFDQLEVIGRALGDEVGKAKLKIAETPELNVVDKEGEEEVSITTLDAWWEYAGQPKIDVIKIDINGSEGKALSGAAKILSETSPLLIISIGEATKKSIHKIQQQLNATEYSLYEYVPGPQLLTSFSLEEEIDPYLMNIIGINEGRVEEFRKYGWLFNEAVETEVPKDNLWKEVLSEQQWTESINSVWEQQELLSQNEEYLQALNYLCAAEMIDISTSTDGSRRSEKGKLMLKAVDILVQQYNKGNQNIGVALSLSRLLNSLGKRGQAVEILDELVKADNLRKQEDDNKLPFLLPLPEQDQTSIQTDFTKWLMVRIVEAWTSLKDVSSYLSDGQVLKLLSALEENPEAIVNTDKKNLLVNRKNNYQGKISKPVKHNSWFWEEKSSKKQEEASSGKNKDDSNKENMPSKVIKVKVNTGDSFRKPICINIPEKEIFRLNNIFKDHEYALPKGFQLKDDGVIVDVGANVGAFALYAKQWNENVEIHCFEPNPQVYPLLEKNTNDVPNVHRNFVALGDSDGELKLFQHPVNTGQSTTSHKVKGAKAVNVPLKHAGNALSEARISKIDVLKIDTEGAEVPILKGLEQLLPHTKVVMVEYHTEEDRRQIDDILENFFLYSADIQGLWGVGTVKYVNKTILK